MNKFIEQYQALSNKDLLRIIENGKDYQPEAVEAANTIIEERKLSPAEVSKAEEELLEEQLEIKRKEQEKRELNEKVNSIFKAIHPIQESPPTTKRLFISILIIVGLMTTALWYGRLHGILYILSMPLSEWDSYVVEYVLSFFIMTIGFLLLGFRKRIGWILITTFITYTTVASIVFLLWTWNSEPVGITILDSFFPVKSKTVQITSILLNSGLIWMLSKNEIKHYLNISRKTNMITFGLALIIAIIMVVPFLFM